MSQPAIDESERARMFVAVDLSEWSFSATGGPFWPHVTVARVRAEGRGSQESMRVEIPPGPAPTGRVGFFNGVRISLYRSELQPSGSHYSPLAQVELPSGQQ